MKKDDLAESSVLSLIYCFSKGAVAAGQAGQPAGAALDHFNFTCKSNNDCFAVSLLLVPIVTFSSQLFLFSLKCPFSVSIVFL